LKIKTLAAADRNSVKLMGNEDVHEINEKSNGRLNYEDVTTVRRNGEVSLGDHMALVLEINQNASDGPYSSIFNDFSVTLEKCWATNTKNQEQNTKVRNEL